MGEIVSFSRGKHGPVGRRAPPRRHRAPRAYSRGWLQAARDTGPILWALPLAVCTVLTFALWPARQVPDAVTSLDDPRVAGLTEAELRAKIWSDTPEALDAQQPDVTPAVALRGPPEAIDRESAWFGQCSGSAGRAACVIDGDTFWYRGEKIRVADINTPETGGARCAYEAERGAKATGRLKELLNAGPFALQPIDRRHDQYGRALYVVTRGGQSIGTTLVNEGLAERWQGFRRDWC